MNDNTRFEYILWNEIQQIFSFNLRLQWVAHLPIIARGGTRSGAPKLTPEEFCIFLSDPDPGPDSDPEYKICEKMDLEPESLFNFGSGRSLCGNFLNKNMGKLQLDRWL